MKHFLDCSVAGSDTELFIVEGKSALNALDQVRSRAKQAVFAVQGKLPNAATRTEQRLLQHQPTCSLLETLGYPQGQYYTAPQPGGQNPEACRFSQVLLATDPDADGDHSRWLVLTLLQRFCKPLLESGRVRVVSAPRFRVGSKDAGHCEYFWSEQDKQQYLATRKASSTDITAFKGLASLSADELHHWVVARKTRQYATPD